MKFGTLLVTICALSLLLPLVCSSQNTADLRLRLQSGAGVPVTGALVALLDAHDSVIAEGLTSEQGTRTLRALPGTYRIRARRIGFLPFISEPVTLPRDGDLVLEVESARVALDKIVVTSKSECRGDDTRTRALSLVWGEIGKALRSSQITTEDLAGIGQAQVFRRVVAQDGSVTSADTTSFTIGSSRPFSAISAQRLATDGYVIGDEQRGWVYYAPDETVLLSEPFATTHCFRLVRNDDHPGLIGVAFEPARNHHVADINGALWVDESSSELREIGFRFVNAGAFSRYGAEGHTHFARLSSGAWIVDAWILRAPILERREGAGTSQLLAKGFVEDGGRVVPGKTK